MSLTKKEKLAMNEIQEGSDVYAYDIAHTLRGIEKKHPDFIKITKSFKGSGAGRVPYFHAAPTDAGKRALRR